MTRISRFVIAAAVFLPLPSAARAQNLAQRVASAADGAVQFTYAARPGVCGNGRSYYSINGSMWFGSVNDNVMRSDPCQPGPVRVVLGRAGKEIVDVNVYVGPVQSSPGVADLGMVPAREAAEYLLSIASKVDGRPGRDAIGPAMLADSAVVTPQLLAIAKDQSRARETRSSAINWLSRASDEKGGVAPAQLAKALGDMARDENDNQQVRQSALRVLSRQENGEGIPALIEISRSTQDVWLGKQALSTLAQSGDPRHRARLRDEPGRRVPARSLREAAEREDEGGGAVVARRDGRDGEREMAHDGGEQQRRGRAPASSRGAVERAGGNDGGRPRAAVRSRGRPADEGSDHLDAVEQRDEGGDGQAARDREERPELRHAPPRGQCVRQVGRSSGEGRAQGHRREVTATTTLVAVSWNWLLQGDTHVIPSDSEGSKLRASWRATIDAK